MMVGVDRLDLGRAHGDVVMSAEHVCQVETHILRGELGCGHLVEQRLELVEAVLVDQGHLDVRLAGQPPGAGDASEPTTDHQYLGWHGLMVRSAAAGCGRITGSATSRAG